LKLCLAFDMPLAQVPALERQALRLARWRMGQAQPLPSATLCYVRSADAPAGSVLRNVYTPRLRWLVLGPAQPGAWLQETRNPQADFLLAFGDEAQAVPAVQALLLGADSDNTGGHSIGSIGSIQLQR
jgi:hypothetical protein